jgi:micrococcal nuclease
VSSRSAGFWILLFIGLALTGGGVDLLRDGNGNEDGNGGARDGLEKGTLSLSGRVLRVVDGDTVKVQLRGGTETVRYIGVDTPESVKPGTPVQCFGKQASDFNRRLVQGRRVLLRFGPERRDRYGRLLAYVYPAGEPRSVSAELIARGYGRELTIPPNSAHQAPYSRLERRARLQRRGLWGSCSLD